MNVIGIDFDSQIINIAVFDSKLNLINVRSINLNNNSTDHVKQLYSLIGNKKNKVSSSLDSKYVLIKTFFLKVKNKFTLKNAIQNQKESITFIDIKDSIILDRYHSNISIVQFYITTKDFLQKHLSKLKHIQIDPEYVTSNTTSLFRFANAYLKTPPSFIIINLGECKTTLVIIEDGVIKSSNTIKIGFSKIKLSHLENKKSNSLDQIDLTKLPKKSSLKILLDELKTEIEKSINVFYKNKNFDELTLFFTGSISEIKDLDVFLKFDKTKVVDIDKKILLKQNDIKKYAIAIGCALDMEKRDLISTQFRVNEFTSKKIKQAIGALSFISFSIILFFTMFFHFYSNKLLDSKEKRLFDLVQNFEKKDFLNMNKNVLLEKASAYQKIDLLSSIIKKEAKDFPFYLKTLKVSSFLKYLNNLDDVKDIEIKKIHYVLEEFPNLSNKYSPYLPKIEIEFSTSDISNARKFHMLLLNEKTIIDTTKDINLDILNKNFKIIFYLKNNIGS
ncbi:MAG: hypothetical protein K1060chlam5_00959 [Candidatus Anoxychlamydiales bacterium]|nr:hypothetical protein [Candidatus Anoxychlamydiales bacterium]